MKAYRKLPDDERRMWTDFEYIFELHTEQSNLSRLLTEPAPVIVLEYNHTKI